MAVIVIDPGDGGTRIVGGSSPNNATGPAGTKEKTLALAVGLAARTALTARGYTVFTTRTSDVNLGLAARAHVARDHRASAFVSIHLNASDRHTAQGTETWLHTSHSARSKRLADRVQARVLAVTKWRDRGVKAKGLGVLSPNSHDPQTACCLVEVSFLDRADEEQKLLTPDYQNAVASAIGDAVDDRPQSRLRRALRLFRLPVLGLWPARRRPAAGAVDNRIGVDSAGHTCAEERLTGKRNHIGGTRRVWEQIDRPTVFWVEQ